MKTAVLPLGWVVVDGIGTVLLALGLLGLLGAPGGALALLARPGVAWALLGTDAALVAVAMAMIIGALRARRPADRR